MTDWSDTPAGTIARLDEALERRGEEVILRRVVGTVNQSFTDVTVLALVTGFKPQELVGGITQESLLLVISPTQINQTQWPGGMPPSFVGDPRIPLKGYKAVVRGKIRSIEGILPRMPRGEIGRAHV